MSPAFASLRVRNYRLFAGGQVVSLTGTWMQRTAQDWLVLTLSHNSGTAIGLVTALQFLPMLLFGLYGGVVADRYDKRRTLLYAQAAMGLLALALGVLTVTGAVRLWQVDVLAFGLGLATVFDTPVRQAFVQEMVGREDLPNAVSLNSATFNSARVVGPAAAGVLIHLGGTGPVFLINALSYLAVIAGLRAIRPEELFAARPVARARGQLREGLGYVRHRPELVVPIVLVGLIGMFGLNFQLTTALIARITFHRDAASYGLLGTCFAAGSLAGALVSARRSGRGQRPRQRTYLVAGLVFGLLEAVTGLMPTFLTFALLLVPTGAAVLTFTTGANSTVQLAADPWVRGRVMAIYVLVFLGGTPVGAPLIGYLAEVFGPRSSLVVGGLVSAASAAGCAAVLAARTGRWPRRRPGAGAPGGGQPPLPLAAESLLQAGD